MNIRKQFPFINNNEGHIYFDSAATSLKPLAVIEAEANFLSTNGNSPHGADYKHGFDAITKIAQVRQKLQTFINAFSENEIIFTSGTTHSINLLANGLKKHLNPGDEILLTDLEHAANMFPWVALARENKFVIKKIPILNNFEIDLAWLVNNISSKTKIITISHITNTLGNENDLKAICETAKKTNPEIIIHADCAQSIAHKKIDVQKIGADFISWSAHKMYGPFGLGFLWGKYEILNKLEPLFYGGGMSQSVNSNLTDFLLSALPNRLEGGTPNISAIYACEKAIDFINDIGIDKINSHELHLKQYFTEQIKNIIFNPKIIFYNLEFPSPIVLFNVQGINPQDVTSFLDQKYKISVRGGAACARRISGVIKEEVAVRASFGIYNTKSEIDKFIEALGDVNNFLETII